jgi:hypothetical protein
MTGLALVSVKTTAGAAGASVGATVEFEATSVGGIGAGIASSSGATEMDATT